MAEFNKQRDSLMQQHWMTGSVRYSMIISPRRNNECRMRSNQIYQEVLDRITEEDLRRAALTWSATFADYEIKPSAADKRRLAQAVCDSLYEGRQISRRQLRADLNFVSGDLDLQAVERALRQLLFWRLHACDKDRSQLLQSRHRFAHAFCFGRGPCARYDQ